MEKIEEIAAKINLSDYNYHLPDHRIAAFPLAERSASKLLYYKSGDINHKQFPDIVDLLPTKSTLFFNNTKVIPARIKFFKSTGAQIELFLLKPLVPSQEISANMAANASVTWECMVGNKQRWKVDQELTLLLPYNNQEIQLTASYVDYAQNHIKLSWNPTDLAFVDIVHLAGLVPLPPYIKRAATETDKSTYQTVYSKFDGAVAAPTAGLHFTPEILEKLQSIGHRLDYLTLHVGAGTFQPLKAEKVTDHPMHREQIVVSKENLQTILKTEGKIIPVGTTSMRTLESLYWYGVKLMNDKNASFFIEKLYPYQFSEEVLPDYKTAIQYVFNKMLEEGLNSITGETEIFIFPGYTFRICNGIITNFHQPGSTLILLVAALVGDRWKTIYQEALENEYRFLSYGDSSFLLP